MEDAGSFWNHAEQRHKIAHDYLFASYVHPRGTHCPLDFRRFRKREQCNDDHPFRDHTQLCIELVNWVVVEPMTPRKILVTNRTHWEAHHILKGYKRRWSGTETFHRDGKQQWDMGECQLRNGVGQTRYMQLVVLAIKL